MALPFTSRGLFGAPRSRNFFKRRKGTEPAVRIETGVVGGRRMNRALLIDALEPRLLFNADVLALDLSGSPDHQVNHDVIVRLVDEVDQTDAQAATVQRVQILDHANNDAVLASADLASIGSIAITGGSGDDTVTIDAKSFGNLATPGFQFDGGAGSDRLIIDTAKATDWSITGQDSGTTSGGAAVRFSGVESLQGAAGNNDTFTVQAGGALSGVIDGGAGGYDVLDFNGLHQTAAYIPTGAQSGDIVVDGSSFQFAGLEPVNLGTLSSMTIDFGAGAPSGVPTPSSMRSARH
jgi:hypothetical protein